MKHLGGSEAGRGSGHEGPDDRGAGPDSDAVDGVLVRRPRRATAAGAENPWGRLDGLPEDEPIDDDDPFARIERARGERRALDQERGEPLSAGERQRVRDARATTRRARPLDAWKTRPRILVTNDDGVESLGLLALRQALEPLGDTYVIAPDTNQSAVGHTKTLMRPLRVRERTLVDGSQAWSVDGSPTDAVSLAFLGYFGVTFDLVASGINYGANLGDDITYSGTVSAAMEAVINSCPAFAISQEYYEHPDFALAGLAARVVGANILQHGLAPGELINVNVPAVKPEDCDGFEVTRMGKRVYQDMLVERLDPRGVPYYWLGGSPPSGLAEPGTDFHAVVNRRVAVTPVQLDLTARRLLRRLRSWQWDLPVPGPEPSERGLDAQ